MSSLAEKLIEEGREKEKHKIAQEMLHEGTDLIFIAKVTKLPIEKIKALQKKGN